LSYPGTPAANAKEELTLDTHDMMIERVDNWEKESWICSAYSISVSPWRCSWHDFQVNQIPLSVSVILNGKNK
jgi:hypothetical protein